MMKSKTLKAPSDRSLDRLIVGAILMLAVGVPLVGALYVFDRYVTPPPTIVDQKTAELESAVRETPNNLPLRMRLAGAYMAAARYDEAVTQFDEVLTAADSLKAEDVLGLTKSAHLGRADAHRLAGDVEAAIYDYRFVVDVAQDGEFANVDVELQAAWFQLGSIALIQERPAEAIEALESALVINETDADTLHLLGRAYMLHGEADKAIESVRRAVLFVPIGWCEPYATLGQAYTALGQAEQATWAAAMTAFCRNDPIDPRPQLQALIGGPAALDALTGLGLIAEIGGDTTAAADWYRQALAMAPDDFTAASGLSRVAPIESHASPDPVGTPPTTVPGGES